MQVTQQRYYTPEEYLELEEAADYKSEYIDGQIIPMAHESINHNYIGGNFAAALNFAFKKLNYQVFFFQMRLCIPKKRIYTYPDVIIVAGNVDCYHKRTDIILNPQVIIEVLSKSTKAYDYHDKFEAYRTIPTFKEYLLIDQNRIYVEQFSKTGKKQWALREYDEEDEAISLVTVPFEISLQDLYNKVRFELGESEAESTDVEG
ncbi:Uma2 family endonuclease [Calothrix sp. FACHB-1219]|uniref:Uma2 family endonuclease n=1 Tax=unclassified Calothrix TaxID=2619626 RepID=UPI00168595EB|nr:MULTISPECIES: Uma2 family endonuclease [unclassified Calothrix]MBD2206285.1 Uma2 family endonuclease [Calothrix sp. FACHB-168]MBD2219181.1 Uma2 family endonuclease [Calothrix sp. FACHB-1219]